MEIVKEYKYQNFTPSFNQLKELCNEEYQEIKNLNQNELMNKLNELSVVFNTNDKDELILNYLKEVWFDLREYKYGNIIKKYYEYVEERYLVVGPYIVFLTLPIDKNGFFIDNLENKVYNGKVMIEQRNNLLLKNSELSDKFEYISNILESPTWLELIYNFFVIVNLMDLQKDEMKNVKTRKSLYITKVILYKDKFNSSTKNEITKISFEVSSHKSIDLV